MRLYAKKAAVGCLVCLALWVIFTYVSFTNSPLGSQETTETDPDEEFRKYLDQRVDKLEHDFRQHLQSNKEILIEIKQKILEEKKEAQKIANDNAVIKNSASDKIAVLVLACNRITVQRCLDLLIKYRPNKEKFPIIVSQDCNHEATKNVLESYANAADSGISLILQPDLSEMPVPSREKKFRGYFNIARHYRFALNHTFYTLGHEAAIIVEDDLDVSPDFYEYFLGTYPLLKYDPTLWCVSAWNDNGKAGLINPAQPELLYRTDFFPGLGWMLLKELWDELQPKWPSAYWDDWIRKPEQRNDRACIRPELPRTRTFGKVGVSNGLFFEKYLKLIKLNDKSIAFTEMDLTYLMKDAYDKKFLADINAATNVTLAMLPSLEPIKNPDPVPPTLHLTYATREEYKKLIRHLGLMEDFRSGVGRTAYLGVVSCFYKGRRVYITPTVVKPTYTYDPSWN